MTFARGDHVHAGIVILQARPKKVGDASRDGGGVQLEAGRRLEDRGPRRVRKEAGESLEDAAAREGGLARSKKGDASGSHGWSVISDQ